MRKLARSVARVAGNLGRKVQSSKTAKLALGAGAVLTGAAAQAQTDATAITTAVNTAFTGVAGACITIGTFFVVYRLVRRIS